MYNRQLFKEVNHLIKTMDIPYYMKKPDSMESLNALIPFLTYKNSGHPNFSKAIDIIERLTGENLTANEEF